MMMMMIMADCLAIRIRTPFLRTRLGRSREDSKTWNKKECWH